VLAPRLGVIIGGSQRQERFEILDTRMAEHGIDQEHYAPTLPSRGSEGGLARGRLRRYCPVPRAGFGLGFKRTVAHVTGLANVRDIPFPRTPGNARY
jgi:asparaginyl-tRNA synthetase